MNNISMTRAEFNDISSNQEAYVFIKEGISCWHDNTTNFDYIYYMNQDKAVRINPETDTVEIITIT